MKVQGGQEAPERTLSPGWVQSPHRPDDSVWPGPLALGLDTGPSPSTSSSWSGQFFPGTWPVYSTSWPKFPLERRESPHSRGLDPDLHNQALFPGSPGQHGGGRPGSAWPAGRVEAGPKTTQPCAICRLPETTGETPLEASQPLLSRPSMAPQGLLEPMSWAWSPQPDFGPIKCRLEIWVRGPELGGVGSHHQVLPGLISKDKLRVRCDWPL